MYVTQCLQLNKHLIDHRRHDNTFNYAVTLTARFPTKICHTEIPTLRDTVTHIMTGELLTIS